MHLRKALCAAAVMSLLFVTIRSQAQNQASCTFTYFVPPSPYNVTFQANGINHGGTVVGAASSSTSTTGMIRYSGGGITFFSEPNATNTILQKRNLNGISVGSYNSGGGSSGLILTPSSHTTLNYPNSTSTLLSGINKSNTIVGTHYDSTTGATQGFKYQNGKFSSIQYPGALQTTPEAINDNGVIVGEYQLGSFENPSNGFVLQNGQYTTLNNPYGVGNTFLRDINNAGTIVSAGGEAGITPPDGLMYKNGTWETIVAPNAYETFVNGINDLNYVTGLANYSDGHGNYTWKAYTALCK